LFAVVAMHEDAQTADSSVSGGKVRLVKAMPIESPVCASNGGHLLRATERTTTCGRRDVDDKERGDSL